jgi:hypothetical protein
MTQGFPKSVIPMVVKLLDRILVGPNAFQYYLGIPYFVSGYSPSVEKRGQN